MLKCIFEKHHVLTTKKTLRNFQGSSFNVWFLPKADFCTVDVKDGAETRIATISSFSVSRRSRLPLQASGFSFMQHSRTRPEFQKRGHDIS